MSSYVLIHGAFHGGWCWSKIIPHLEKEGHKVVAPDLPGHGKYNTPQKLDSCLRWKMSVS